MAKHHSRHRVTHHQPRHDKSINEIQSNNQAFECGIYDQASQLRPTRAAAINDALNSELQPG